MPTCTNATEHTGHGGVAVCHRGLGAWAIGPQGELREQGEKVLAT